jgi:hypothetical protein
MRDDNSPIKFRDSTKLHNRNNSLYKAQQDKMREMNSNSKLNNEQSLFQVKQPPSYDDNSYSPRAKGREKDSEMQSQSKSGISKAKFPRNQSIIEDTKPPVLKKNTVHAQVSPMSPAGAQELQESQEVLVIAS